MKKCLRSSNKNTDHSAVEVSLKGYGLMNKSVNSSDVLVGALIGAAGASAAKAIVNKIDLSNPGMIPDLVKKGVPLLGAAAGGTIAYALQSKGARGRATGHLVGAVAVGTAVTAWDVLKANLPQYFGDVVSLRLARYPGMGVFVDERTPSIGPGGMGGLLVDEGVRAMGNYADNPNLAALAQVSMGDDDDGIDELAG